MVLVHLDAGRALTSAVSDKRSFEGGLSIDTDIYFINAEVGQASIRRTDSYDYLSEGLYYRVGISKNLSPYDKERNYFTFGINYARSYFSNEMSFNYESPYYGTQVIDRQTENLSARWWELTGGIKIRVWEQLYLGYIVRVKIFKDLYGSDGIQPWDIPGFGRHKRSGASIKSSTVGLNYRITWRIPYRDKPVPKKPK